MRAMRILAAVVLVCVGLVGVTTSPAFACSCAFAERGEQLSWADVVFVGTLTDRSQDGDDMSGTVRYTFDVSDVYEGQTISPVEVTTGVQGTACGLPGLAEDETYLVLADANDDGLNTGSCSGTAEATSELVQEVADLSGPPSEPTAAPPDDTPPVRAAAAIVVAVLAVSALLVRALRAVID